MQTKLAIYLGGLLFLVLSNLGSYFYGHYKGVQDQIGEQAKAEVGRVNNINTAVIEHSKQIVEEVKKDQAIGAKANERYETAVEKLHERSKADRDSIRANGGLRFTTDPSAGSDKPSIEAITSSTTSSNEISARTIVLPQYITEDLLNLTDEADEVSERLRVLQEWIKEQGLYGPSQ